MKEFTALSEFRPRLFSIECATIYSATDKKMDHKCVVDPLIKKVPAQRQKSHVFAVH